MLKIYRKLLRSHVLPIFAIIALEFLQAMSDLYLPTIMSNIINDGIMKEDVDYIVQEGLSMLLVSAFGVACALSAIYLSSKVMAGFGREIRDSIFEHVESFSLGEFDRFGPSTLVTRTTNDVMQIQAVTIMLLNVVLYAAVLSTGGVILAYSKDRRLTVLLLIALPFVAAAIYLIARFTIPLFRQIQKKIDRVNLILSEYYFRSKQNACRGTV